MTVTERSKRRRALYAINGDKVREQKRSRYAANREKIAARRKVLNAANSEKIAERNRAYYAANRQSDGAYRAENRATQTRRRVAWLTARAELKSGGCVDCGVVPNDLTQLHFHHVDPATKSFVIADAYRYSSEVRAAELAKCVIVCQPCHARRHRALRA